MSRLLLLLLVTLSLFPIHTLSQNVTKIDIGSSITASRNSTPWLSPGGHFAFGFHSPKNDSAIQKFVIAIWFNRVPGQTMAWFARISDPVPIGSILALQKDGFVLLDSQRKLLYKVTGDLTGKVVAYASLSDAGNLVLSNGVSKGYNNNLWESFKNPTDTILPTQAIEMGAQLISKKSESDFSHGRFYARMTTNGNFVLNTKTINSNSDFENEYYASKSPSGNRLLLSQSSTTNITDISVVSKTGSTAKSIFSSNLTSSSGYYYRATIEFDGVFSLYYFSMSSFGWMAVGTLPENACLSIMGDKGSGACGFNNVCGLLNNRPSCNCTEGFSLVDKSNPYGDCKSNFTGNCVQGGADQYALVVAKDVDWPLNDYEQIAPSTSEECKSACSADYFCGAAIYRNSSCWKKRLPLSNGRIDVSLNVTTFLKVRKG